MKKSLAILCFCFSFYCGMAQNHNYNPGCRYTKSNVTSDDSCPACQKDRADQKKAWQEESKQLQAKAAAEQAKKMESDKKAKEEAAQKKISDQKQRDENKIVIGILNPQKEPINKPVNKKTDVNDNTIMVAFQDWEGERLFGVRQYGFMDTSKNLLSFAGQYPNTTSTFYMSGTSCYHQSTPHNLGLIRIGYKYVDIVYPSGKREFNDNSISEIKHLRDNFFIIIKDGYNNLYDIKTKMLTRLPVHITSNTSNGYTPIFDELSYEIPEHIKRNPGDFVRYIPSNKELKDKAINDFPTKVTEELLKRNSFCLLISYSNNPFFDIHSNARWNPQFVYVSKTGELIIK